MIASAEREHILTAFETIVVFFESFRRSYTKVRRSIEATLLRGSPSSIIIRGPSGSGKSTLIECIQLTLESEHKELREDGEYTIIPVVNFETPPEVTIKGMARAMLIAVGISNPRGSTEEMTHQLITILKTRGTKIVFLDEIQRLCLPTADKVRPKALAWIVGLANALRIPIILAGTEECEVLQSDNKDYNQKDYSTKAFKRRYPFTAKMEHLKFSAAFDSEFQQFIRSLDSRLYELTKLPDGLHLHDPLLSAQLFMASDGNLETLRLTIWNALRECLDRNPDQNLTQGLTLEDFIYAYELTTSEESKLSNPFTLTLESTLEQIGEMQRQKELDRKRNE
ncbi:TniB family NTP-binding protein [Pseudomonas sp. 43(2021)]|uniref:TniB family NTP-binding protein n=1 Tax=Pseudomonas sp. 43(2021) TaxID=2813560 RepID=UPI001A9E65A5|nr:TniB family NTP-binding protein [Pseudomonas sp. 43(2021)]